MRIPSGSTDRKIAFVAVDATDLKTRETALSGFTVYRSRDGGVATAYTTPTIAELSAANMPGVYVLTIDEDTTLAAAHDTEEYVLHITHASMAPVTRALELYRPETTEGRTLSLETDGMGHADLKEWLGVAPLALASQRVEARASAMAAALITATEAPNLDAAVSSRAVAGDAMAMTAAAINLIWDELTSEGRTLGSFGQLFKDFVDATISGRASAGSVAAVQADTDDIQARLPAALVSGRMDSSVGAMAASVITAAAIAAGALEPGKAAADFFDAIFTRSSAAWEASAAKKSLGTAIMKAAHRTRDNLAGAHEVFRSDGITLHASQAITTDATLPPIKEVGGAT